MYGVYVAMQGWQQQLHMPNLRDDGGMGMLGEPIAEGFLVSRYVPFMIANSISCLFLRSSSPSG